MKLRLGFVSNSSSSSFIIEKKYLSEHQLDLIRNHQNSGEEYADTDPWEIKESDTEIEAFTIIDNFDFLDYLRKIKVDGQFVKIWTD